MNIATFQSFNFSTFQLFNLSTLPYVRANLYITQRNHRHRARHNRSHEIFQTTDDYLIHHSWYAYQHLFAVHASWEHCIPIILKHRH